MGAVATVAPRASAGLASGAVFASAGDPSSSRIVYGIVVALLVIGVALVAVAVWVFRQTRVDPEVLAPLETMSDRRWRRLDPASQRRMLDEERPEGAEPLRPATSVPVPDEEFASGSRPVDGFDDLKADPDDAAGDAEADVRADAGGAGAVEDGDDSDVDDDEGSSVDEPSVDERGSESSAGDSPVEVDAVDEDGSDDSPVDVDESVDETPVGVVGSDHSPVDVDESVDETPVGVVGSDEPPVDADESVNGPVRGDGAPGTVEESLGGTSPTDEADADSVAPLDGADPIASGSVVGAVDETPPVGGEARPGGELDATDEPARTDG